MTSRQAVNKNEWQPHDLANDQLDHQTRRLTRGES